MLIFVVRCPPERIEPVLDICFISLASQDQTVIYRPRPAVRLVRNRQQILAAWMKHERRQSLKLMNRTEQGIIDIRLEGANCVNQ
ncbi:hypothetical protein N5C81_23060 [Rhizobium pusense]|uniref:hypothetical protein n=1 Tax=Agrobacterium pusense TaxID=648995 RepID=UPI0024473746|nr:hypothetical protein [Agrobacterium pusense]MDH1270499.1 hypothetical protein [Agrobacterium pusense]